MQVNYQREINHTYMTIQSEKELDMAAYPIRMLLGNEIASLVPCRIQVIDGGKLFRYDIGGRQTVEMYFLKQKIGKDTIRFLMQGIIQVIEEMQAFLMDVNQLVIQPEFIYYDGKKKCLQFCYFPGYDKQIHEQMRNFLEMLLPMLDHSQPQAVAMGYGMYQAAIENGFHLDQLKEYLYKEEEEKQPAVKQIEEEIEAEEEKEEQEEKEKTPWDTLIFSCVWTVVLLGICGLRFLGYLDFLTVSMLLGIFIFVMIVVAFNAVLWKKHQKKDTSGKQVWKKSNVLQASIQWPGKSEVDIQEVKKIYEEEQKKQEDEFVQQEKQELHASCLGDTQQLPSVGIPANAWMISKNKEKWPDIELTGDLTVIGKEESTDVQILSPTVSRLHAKICRNDEQYYIRDLDSRNGTFVNGNKISGKNNHRLLSGDEIYFADVGYIFRI